MMDPFLKVTQGSFHQAMYVLVQQLADDLSRVVCFDFIAHAQQARNTIALQKRLCLCILPAEKSKQPNHDKSSSVIYTCCALFFSVVFSVVKRQVY